MTRIVNLANFPQFTAINVLSDPGAIGGPVVIPNACKFMIVWTLTDGKTGRNILGMQVPPGFTPTVAIAETARAALVAGARWTTLAGYLATGTALAAVELLDIRTANNAVLRSTGPAAPGTSSGVALPSEVAIAVTLRTAKTGPAFRGRFYVPGWGTTAVGTGDVVAAAALTALNDWVSNQVGTAISGTGGTWSLLQPARQAYTGSTGTEHPARGAGTVALTQAVARDNHWDTQRRRGLK